MNAQLRICEHELEVDQSNYESLLANARDTRALFKYYKSIKNPQVLPPSVFWKHSRATSNLDKATLFNRFFRSVFTTPSSIFQPSDTQIQISDYDVSLSKITKVTSSLDVSKSTGPDRLPAALFRNCKALSKSIASLFKSIKHTSIFPSDWKVGMVKPLHKKDNKAKVENYRPITLLSIISKVYEKCIFDPLYEHVANLMPTTQFGFQKKKSTITQLLVYLGEIYSNVDISEQVVDAVYLDFSKAFDKIDHNILLSKLSKIGVRGNMLKVLQSYLKNRQQFVDIEGRASEYLWVSSGVPQGSILGPLLFLIYLIDLPNDLSSEVFSFADDSKLLSLHKHNEPCDLQFDLDRLWNWCTSHQNSFNIDKCCVMHFKTKNCGPFYLGCNELKTSSCEKDLGVKVSSSLKWSEHIKFASAKAIKVLFLLKRSSAKQLQASTKVISTSRWFYLSYATGAQFGILQKRTSQNSKTFRRKLRTGQQTIRRIAILTNCLR